MKKGKYFVGFLILAMVVVVISVPAVIKKLEYNYAIQKMQAGDYEDSIKRFEEFGEYKEAQVLLKEAKYLQAMELIEKKEYELACTIFLDIRDYKDADELYLFCKYNIALIYFSQKSYDRALDILYSIETYGDSYEIINEILYMQASEQLTTDVVQAYFTFARIEDYKDSKKMMETILSEHQDNIYNSAIKEFESENMDDALERFTLIPNWRNAKDYIGKIELYNMIQGTWEYRNTVGVTYTDILTISGYSMIITHKGTSNDQVDHKIRYEYYNNRSGFALEGESGEFANHFYISGNSIIREIGKDLKWKYTKISESTEVQPLKEPCIGMTASEVQNSTWGIPEDINSTTYSWGTHEQWCYPGYRYIYFEDGVVTAISE